MNAMITPQESETMELFRLGLYGYSQLFHYSIAYNEVGEDNR